MSLTHPAATEHDEQVALFEWAQLMVLNGRYPELGLLFAIPNGGHRHKAVARKMQEEGVKPGVPDICLPVPRGGMHGMFLELKVGDNRPTEEQKEWQRKLHAQGYYVVTCWGFEQARDEIVAYLELETIPDLKQEIRRLAEELSMMRHHWTSSEEAGELSKELEELQEKLDNERLSG